MLPNPFLDDASDDADDLTLVSDAQQGSTEALEALIRRHQLWIYNIVRRMTYNPHDAEDATQEILVTRARCIRAQEASGASSTRISR